MSRRHFLEDSDSDESGGNNGATTTTTTTTSVSASADANFFTPVERLGINRCNIQINNDGKYSDEYMHRSIAKLGEPPLEKLTQAGEDVPLHLGYCIKKGEEKQYFERNIYKVHGSSGGDDGSPSEEDILLEVGAIRKSDKAGKNRMFKTKAGGVIFGPWWNYSLQRLLDLSADKNQTPETLGQYTAIIILRSMFCFITQDLAIVKPATSTLPKLTSQFGIDWPKATQIARKVINHLGGSSHFLNRELSAVEAHVEGLKSKSKATATATTENLAANSTSSTVPANVAISTQDGAAERRKSEARKKRLAEMKATSRKSVVVPAAVAAAPSAPIGRESFAQGSTVQNNNMGYGQKPPPENGYGSTKPPPRDNGYERKQPPAVQQPPSSSYASMSNTASAQPSSSYASMTNAASTQPTHAANSYASMSNGTRGAQQQPPQHGKNASNTTTLNDGWGRKREGSDAQQPYKSKGSWKFARGVLSTNIEVDNPTSLNPSSSVSSNIPARPPHAAAASARIPDPGQARDDYSRSRDYNDASRSSGDRASERIQDRGGRSYSDRGQDSRSSGRYDDGDNRRYNERDSYSRSDSRGSRDYSSRRDDYGASNSRGRDRDTYRGDEYDRSRDREGYGSGGGSGYAQGSSRSRRQDLDDRDARPQKRFKGPSEVSAPPRPVAPVGRGRGADVNKPAWMTQQNSGPTGMPSNSAVSNPDLRAGTNTSYTPASASSTAPAFASSVAAPVGRGRGAHMNKPAWMTQGQHSVTNVATAASVNQSTPSLNTSTYAPPAQQQGQTFTSNTSSLTAPSAGGSGRGRGMTLPAWMTQQGQTSVANNAPTGMPPAQSIQQHTPPAMNQPSYSMGEMPNNGQGMGRGRGRGRGGDKNLPACELH